MLGGTIPARLYTFSIPSIMCTSCTADISSQLQLAVGVHEFRVIPNYVRNESNRDEISGGTVQVAVTDFSMTAASIQAIIRDGTIKNHEAQLTNTQDIQVQPRQAAGRGNTLK